MEEQKQDTKERGTFVVRILNTQNATWQGTVTWTDGKRTEAFRSALELIRLMDSTLLAQEEEMHTDLKTEAKPKLGTVPQLVCGER